ncbi:efflux RND transporter permease subunit [Microcoleus vaginatus]|uniref:efflux RND transporter permease subunit n=1 Tax=Microcoleus vaginatus TaxID=119532 RepID=UPI001F61925F|nr:AcrB/AcrD/AcrF family protein [Microcoleus vaginatus HSN003]
MTADKPGFSISATAIRRHIGTLMLTLAIIIVGFFYITQLPVDLLPSITYPRIGVRLNAPGVSPEVAIDEVTRPLEQGLSATEGVMQVFSRTREGQVSVDLFFKPGGNIDQALNDATAAVNRIRNRLPDTVESPTLFKVDPSQQPIYEFALTSNSLQGVDLRVFADEELSRELNVIPGIAAIDVAGGVQEEIQVNIDLNRLQSLGVSISDVLSALESRNLDTSGGRLRQEAAEPLTRTVGRFKNAKEIQAISFQASGSNPPKRVFLRDFAQVIDGTEEERVKVFLNQKAAVKISIQKQPDANTISVVDGIKKRLEELKASGAIPEGTTIVNTFDESKFIRDSISNVLFSGLTGAVLAGAAVLLFLASLRQTLIIVLAIPLATLMAIILMGVFGLSLNVFSLGGLALGVGIVVDNSIVMLENIVEGTSNKKNANGQRFSNKQLIQQAEKSSQELESALFASTLTNLVAVLPFLLIGGLVSLLFNELILTITFSVAASLIVGLTVVPMMASRLLALRVSSGLSNFWPLRAFDRAFTNATAGYGKFLSGVVRWRLIIIAVAIIGLGGGSWLMAGQIPQEILPRINTGQARLFALFPAGTNLATNQKIMAEADKIILSQPETQYTLTTVGGLLFGNNTIENVLRGGCNITLKPGTNTLDFVQRVTKELNKKIDLPKNTRLRLIPENVRGLVLTNSPVRGAEVDVLLQGENEQILQQAGREILATLDEKVKLATFRPDGDPQQTEVQIRPNWEQAEIYGLNARQIGEAIQTAIQGSVPTQLQRGNRLVDVRVQFDRAAVQSISALKFIPLTARDNSIIRLSDVANIELGKAPGEIQRLNQRQVFMIAGNVNKGASLGDALKQVDEVLSEIKLPQGVRVIPSAAAETNRELQSSLIVLGSLAAFLVFVVMAVQYNSLVDPLVIMLTVPLALAGGIFGLYATKTAIGATVIVGAILLVGIVVNNAIIMVELANQILEDEKVDRTTAILKAAPQRLRPILMTTITTVLGLFPLALGIGDGSEFLQPLGVVVFSGLSLATLLTLFIIPCFYILLHDFFGIFAAKKKPQAVAIPVQKAGRKTPNL